MIREKGAAIERKTSERCTIEMREVGRVTVDRGGWEVGGRGGGLRGGENSGRKVEKSLFQQYSLRRGRTEGLCQRRGAPRPVRRYTTDRQLLSTRYPSKTPENPDTRPLRLSYSVYIKLSWLLADADRSPIYIYTRIARLGACRKRRASAEGERLRVPRQKRRGTCAGGKHFLHEIFLVEK